MYVYYLFYKPFRVLSQFSPEGDKKTLADYLPAIEKDVYPVGRLDYDSEGLLFLTNDKKLNHRLLDPGFGHEREYWAQVEGVPDNESLEKLRNGVRISSKGKSFITRPAKVGLMPVVPALPDRDPPIRFRKNIPDSWLSLTLVEGKNRQVRKMTAAVGHPTLRLLRCRIGTFTLQGLAPGNFIQLTAQEARLLLSSK